MENTTFLYLKRGILYGLTLLVGAFVYIIISSFNKPSFTGNVTASMYLDTDGDGVPDNKDMDDDGDGILDIVEKNDDDDGDGIPNRLDIDSDNDGILDIVEAQTSKGFIPPSGYDVDGNGLDDAYERSPGSCDGLTPVDTDKDHHPDFRDIDSDNDGILDNVEAQPTKGFLAPCGVDSDGNGLDDHYEKSPGSGDGLTPVDTDKDHHPDFRDIDSDNDGILDNVEAQPTKGFLAPCGVDSDGNGLDDHYEKSPGSGDGLTPVDTDKDHHPDFRDIDSDNDGILDNVEAQPTKGFLAPCGVDSDGNGLDDHYEKSPGSGDGLTPVDTDKDHHPDFRDIDSDNDGIPDNVEGQPTSGYVAPSGSDTDGDGLDDAYEGSGDEGITPEDTDGDTTNPTTLTTTVRQRPWYRTTTRGTTSTLTAYPDQTFTGSRHRW